MIVYNFIKTAKKRFCKKITFHQSQGDLVKYLHLVLGQKLCLKHFKFEEEVNKWLLIIQE